MLIDIINKEFSCIRLCNSEFPYSLMCPMLLVSVQRRRSVNQLVLIFAFGKSLDMEIVLLKYKKNTKDIYTAIYYYIEKTFIYTYVYEIHFRSHSSYVYTVYYDLCSFFILSYRSTYEIHISLPHF